LLQKTAWAIAQPATHIHVICSGLAVMSKTD